jgi:hypothetical protein
MRAWGKDVTGTWLARRGNVIALVGLVGWLLFDLTARTVFGSTPWPQSVVDYTILYHASQHVVETHQFPDAWPYPYPPPAIAIHAASALFPFTVSAALWITLTGLAAIASYLMLARSLGLDKRPGLLLLLPLTHLVVAYYFQWDMRSINCNLIVLAAVVFGCVALASGREVFAGFWFALAVALKLLPILLLPYLAWTRRWRAFASALFFSLVFWVAVPLVAFGPDGFSKVYAGWKAELSRASDPTKQHPILISLDKAALHATGQDPTTAKAIVLGVWVLWVVVGLAGAMASWGNRSRDGFSILTHASLLVLGPAAVNPYLEPYHLVPLAVPAVLLLAAMADTRQRLWLRILAAVGFVVGLVILKVSSPWPLRGLLVNAQALVLCSIAVIVAWARVKDTPVSETPPATHGRRFAALFRRLLAPRAGV